MENYLIILKAAASPGDRQALVRLAPPMQMSTERVFTSQTAASATVLRSMAGVEAVIAPQQMLQDEAVLNELSDQERLFVKAWLKRHEKKQRSGDRLNWDTPPMQPPDAN